MKFFKKQLSVLLLLIICGGVIFSSISVSEASTSYGNTNSNIKNGGQSVIYKSNSYTVGKSPNYKYSYDYDGLWPQYSYTIYKDDNTGKHIKTITKNATSAPSLNIKSGWIYYLGISSNSNPGIYKVKIDGTNKTRLTSISMQTYRGSLTSYKPMIIKDNYIYYLDGPRILKRISINGKEKKTIYTSKYIMGDFSISGDYIYVLNTTNRSYWPGTYDTIVRINTAGKGAKQIIKSTTDTFIYDMVYYNGYIYYQDGYGIYRIKSNGTNKKCVVKLSNEETYAIHNKKIYYINNGDLMRCNLDGLSKKKLKDLTGNYNEVGCIAGNNIYLYLGSLQRYAIYNLRNSKIYYQK